MPTTLEAADGQWPRLLMELGGLSAEQLKDSHQPCPACGGTDRYRWDRDDGPGGWFCNRCGGKDHAGGAGSGVDLLMRVQGWDLRQACAAVERHLGIARDRPAPPTAGAERFWPYTPDFIVCRFPDPVKGKAIRPLWWTGGKWQWKSPPKPRPLYWARRAAAAPVVIAEGEPATDAAAQLFPDHAAVTWPGGCPGVDKADWSALRGRSVVIWPDADQPGRKAAATLAGLLLAIDCSVVVVNVPDDLSQGWDLANGLAEGWDAARATDAVERYGRAVERPEAPPAPPEPPAAAPAPVAASLPSQRFECLGFDEGSYYYQPHATGQITRLARGHHTETHLLALVPELAYWESLYPAKTGVNWSAAKASLFAQQAAVGIFSPERIRGRGAWWDDGRSVLHLGDRLIVDGTEHSVRQPPATRFSYQRLARIDLPTDLQPLTDQEGMELLDLASRFHWEVPASGLLLAGWTALAPICGSLAWRPHIWLTASAGSGKSAILDRLLGQLLGDLALWPEGSTSEASIRQELRCDALPVVMDEAESNEQPDRKRIQDILALARVASSSGRGFVGRGGADGAAQRFVVRSMFLLCSIATALKQGADASRFAQLTLRNPSFLPQEQRQAHWLALDRDLSAITPQHGHRLALRSVGLIPTIQASIAVFRRVAAMRFDSQRQGDQYGSLLAGAWSLMNDRVPTESDALGLIDSNDWSHYREASEQSDEHRCLQTILQHQIRVEADRGSTLTRTVAELVELLVSPSVSLEISSAIAEAHLGRLGLKVEAGALIVSNTALGIGRILRETAWASSWATVLSRVKGADRCGVTRFRGLSGVSRAVRVPLASI